MKVKTKDWGSIFPKLSIDPSISSWEKHLFDITPVEKIGEMYFKREDKFAPLGYGGINGSKLRQAIWLINKQSIQDTDQNKSILISGASVKSPQLPMSSAVAYHFGYDSVHVIGATKPETCMNKEMVKMATWFKARFIFLKVGYNPVLQSKVDKIVSSDNKFFKLNYGITISEDSNIKDIVEFHYIGANQVKNIPDHIENIILPLGSGNSAISILYGLSKFRPKSLKNIYLLGIGPNKLEFLNNRLKLIKEFDKVNTLNFNIDFETDKLNVNPSLDAYNLKYIDIHSIPKYNYQNEVKFTYEDLEFHPTYEAKMMDFISINYNNLISEKTLFWIVGSKPFIENMKGCEELGEVKLEPNVYQNEWK